MGDAIRNIYGTTSNYFIVTTGAGASGAFTRGVMINNDQNVSLNNVSQGAGYAKDSFDASRVVPTDVDNHPAYYPVAKYITY